MNDFSASVSGEAYRQKRCCSAGGKVTVGWAGLRVTATTDCGVHVGIMTRKCRWHEDWKAYLWPLCGRPPLVTTTRRAVFVVRRSHVADTLLWTSRPTTYDLSDVIHSSPWIPPRWHLRQTFGQTLSMPPESPELTLVTLLVLPYWF